MFFYADSWDHVDPNAQRQAMQGACALTGWRLCMGTATPPDGPIGGARTVTLYYQRAVNLCRLLLSYVHEKK